MRVSSGVVHHAGPQARTGIEQGDHLLRALHGTGRLAKFAQVSKQFTGRWQWSRGGRAMMIARSFAGRGGRASSKYCRYVTYAVPKKDRG